MLPPLVNLREHVAVSGNMVSYMDLESAESDVISVVRTFLHEPKDLKAAGEVLMSGSKGTHNEAGKRLVQEARRLYIEAVKLGFKKEADEGLLKTLTKLRPGVSGTESALILLDAAVLPDLETIQLESPDFSQITSSPIANCQHLKYLYVSGGLTDNAFATLFGGARPENLTELWLDGNNLTDKGMSTLATAIKSNLMASLESLNMSQNQITDQGANP